MQKLELNVASMQKQLSDYEANKWKANVNLVVAILSAVIDLASFIVTMVKGLVEKPERNSSASASALATFSHFSSALRCCYEAVYSWPSKITS